MLSLLFAAAISVPFSITNDTAVSRHGALVTAELPLAAGAARDAKQLRVVGYDQLSVPAQIAALEKWPDGSLRRVRALFTADFDQGEKKEWTLMNGSSSARSRFEAKARIEGIDAVLNSGVLHYRTGELLGLWTIQPTAGAALVTAAAERAEIEEAGPVRAVARRDGWMMRDREKVFRYTERWNVVAGQPAVRVAFAIAAAETTATPVKTLFFDIKPNIHHLRTVTLGTAGGANNLSPSDARRLEQPVVPARPITDRQHPGWINWRSDVDVLFFAVKDFWQRAPKAIEIKAGGTARCELHSSAASPLTLGPGKEFSDEFILWFHGAGDSFDEALAEMNQPLQAVIAPPATPRADVPHPTPAR